MDGAVIVARAANRLRAILVALCLHLLFVFVAKLILAAVLMHGVGVLTVMVSLVAHRLVENALRQIRLPLVDDLAYRPFPVVHKSLLLVSGK